ncbi:Glycosyl transferase family 2 [Rubripirellula lacrimiformis]|uniref:Glycosyl transferase family 2 n=1 Tax=Rubripirellula lacrimiformis TaxID=1930273 RepID=A0A517NEB1_9BACT|nr:glycosyltransferase family 2 protein [Rubripirellula lacrimiformis]QDT05461.1 Glycosyl transferase family 2 [Rubripirellula lacrimiformis]
MHDVTFGITTFNRPGLVRRLVESIRLRYPRVRIVVADNGNVHARLPDDVEVLRMPFDCGLSRARNALIDHLQTDYLLILEDDFLFTEETQIEPMREVLQADETIGAVGGAIRGADSRVTCYALDIEVCRRTMRVREAIHRVEVTASGIAYRLCDMVWNFALFRREMLAEHRWVDKLKIGEHCPFFYEIKLAGNWRIAACSVPRIYHVPQPRPKDYLVYRRRAAAFFEAYLRSRGIDHYKRILPYHFEDDAILMPSLIVLAVGHSGTTIVTRMLQQMGWNLGPADQEFAEHATIRDLNERYIQTGRWDGRAALAALQELPQPWVIKDPRFVSTLHRWLPVIAKLASKPTLLQLRRDRDALRASYRRRGAPGDLDFRLDQMIRDRDRQYDRWPYARLTLEYESVAAAVMTFDLNRAQQGDAAGRATRDPRTRGSAMSPSTDCQGVTHDSSSPSMFVHSESGSGYDSKGRSWGHVDSSLPFGFGIESDSYVPQASECGWPDGSQQIDGSQQTGCGTLSSDGSDGSGNAFRGAAGAPTEADIDGWEHSLRRIYPDPFQIMDAPADKQSSHPNVTPRDREAP